MKRLSSRGLERRVADALRESVRVVRRLGFQPLTLGPLNPDRVEDPESDRPPRSIDWDELDGRFGVGAYRLPRVA